MNNEPRWLIVARRYIGVKEAPGAANSPTIMGWAKKLGARVLGTVYNADSVPWCGLFCAEVMSECSISSPSIAVRASSWDNFGVDARKPYLGAIVRFAREGGGHVAMIVGQDTTHFQVLGGNQSDQVCLTWIDKSRAVAFRWPATEPSPTILAPMVARFGSVSINEA